MAPLSRRLLTGALVLPVLALAACGSSAPAAGPPPAATSATTSATPAPPADAASPTTGVSPVAVLQSSAPAPTAAGTLPATSPTSPTSPTAPAAVTQKLPDGTTSVFPQHRVVALYGPPDGSITSNILGRITPTQAVAMTKTMAAAYKGGGKPVLPAFEVIAQIAQASPGQDGDYAAFYNDADIQKWVDAATKAGFLVVLDLQPGQGDFLAGAQHLTKWLKLPNVGLALDAEWNMKKGEIPGQVIGTVDAAKVNQVSAWLTQLTAADHLPQKLFVVHQFTDSAVTNKTAIVERSNLATVIHVDGFGGQAEKTAKYADLSVTKPGEYNGFKLFLTEDVGLLTPQQTLALKPAPDLITYQ